MRVSYYQAAFTNTASIVQRSSEKGKFSYKSYLWCGVYFLAHPDPSSSDSLEVNLFHHPSFWLGACFFTNKLSLAKSPKQNALRKSDVFITQFKNP